LSLLFWLYKGNNCLTEENINTRIDTFCNVSKENERNLRAVACLIARDAGADYSTPFHSGMSRVIRHTCWIFKLFFTGEEIARPCARTSELWHQLKLNTHAFLV